MFKCAMKPLEDHLFEEHPEVLDKEKEISEVHKTKNKREIHKLSRGKYFAFEFCIGV
jgi:hypothetical protein